MPGKSCRTTSSAFVIWARTAVNVTPRTCPCVDNGREPRPLRRESSTGWTGGIKGHFKGSYGCVFGGVGGSPTSGAAGSMYPDRAIYSTASLYGSVAKITAAVLYDTWRLSSRATMPGVIRAWTEDFIRREGRRIAAYSTSAICINNLYIQYPMGERMGQIIDLTSEIPPRPTKVFHPWISGRLQEQAHQLLASQPQHLQLASIRATGSPQQPW